MGLGQRLIVAGLTLAGVLDPQPDAAGPYRTPSPSSETSGAPAQSVRPWRRTKTRPRIAPLPVNITRWIQRDVESAAQQASTGDLARAAQLYRAFGRDGVIKGVMGTRTGGLVRLPKRFAGSPKGVATVEGTEGRASIFDTIFPPAELERLDADGIALGVGVAQFVQAETDRYPVLVRLDPEFLVYRWAEDRWYYRSLEGLLPITPGDGRWVLHTPLGRFEPWNHGLWQALGRSYISKEHGILYRENYASKIANPARVAVAPQGAGEVQKQSWFRAVMAWGVNSVFGVTPGYDVKLLESNGRGFEVFQDMITTADRENIIALAGQVVTVDGGAGFANADIHKTIRADLIQGDGNALAATLNAQALPAVVYDLCGDGEEVTLAWDTRPPEDLKAGAESISATAKAITDIADALAAHGLTADVAAIASRFAVPVLNDRNGDGKPDDANALPGAPRPPALTEGGST